MHSAESDDDSESKTNSISNIHSQDANIDGKNTKGPFSRDKPDESDNGLYILYI